MRETSDNLLYDQQNLWIVDERLTYHSFIASDKPLSSIEHLENQSAKRPDLLVFDRRLVIGPGEQPISSIFLVEFKRPQRDDYTLEKNPLQQAFELVEEIRVGKFKDEKGRPISVASANVPASYYAVADLTSSLKRVLKTMEGAFPTADQQGYFGYHRNYNVYYEVVDYNKLLRDSQKRNRIFFDKLNILGNR
jgi:hypothetical protein